MTDHRRSSWNLAWKSIPSLISHAPNLALIG